MSPELMKQREATKLREFGEAVDHYPLKLEPEFKAKWLEALRSGKFKQAKGTLREEPPQGGIGYCCLGVACEISGATDALKRGENMPGNSTINEWFGLGAYDETGSFEICDKLAGINDETELGFVGIANLIEAHL